MFSKLTLARFGAKWLLFATAAWGAISSATATPVVPGYERLHRQGAGVAVEAGEVLLSELSCLACHQGGDPKSSALTWKAGPDLSAAGDRLRAAYVRQFLADPAAVKPGTTMPDVLAGQPPEQRAELIENLTHYLMQRRTPQPAAQAAVGVAEKGAELFQSVGCIACHSEVPLAKLSEKYAPGQLAQFLAKPLAVRPAGRMPDLRLQPQEAADLAAHLAPEAVAAEPMFAVDAAKAERGGQAFQSLGCASCHGGGPAAQVIAVNKTDAGCLAEKPATGRPHYQLTKDQRTALQSALQIRAQGPRVDDPQLAARHAMLQRNCFACHQRDGLGGPAPEVAVHFTSNRDDLGDLGRLPPPLDGVGRKLQQSAVENVLRGEQLVRKYMRVRMPDFGPELSPHLAALFATADADPQEKPTPAKSEPNRVGRNADGREIVGTRGYACIACHELYGHPSLGIGAYDMAEMPKRLRPEWMRDFLLDPAKFPTGARMPAFFPDGKPVNPKLGTTERQIDSIRVYLTEVDQSLPPEGFSDPAAFELKPKERPIVFRTFMKDAGMHAIAVGFPQGVHAAFDSREVRWALAWRGRFLDADGTWNQRVAKIETPLGDAIVALEKAGALEIVGAETKPAFRGYRIGADGVPTFLYDLGALHIEDRIAPIDSQSLRRTLRVSGQTKEVVQFAAQPPAGLRLRVAGRTELPARLEFRQGVAEITEEISW